ncbi:hypothetical protein GWI33_018966 [Rhynchophorus ferrugineus]|uniref:Uncharacterized protein n=1 Tax=Rhynchophorus ferrugineus TaxID=354439 RepID=A0A834M7G9_RHYFE|nr:hypothetical protein GWI33_018966 [Rhynchophorus ferrugineus]
MLCRDAIRLPRWRKRILVDAKGQFVENDSDVVDHLPIKLEHLQFDCGRSYRVSWVPLAVGWMLGREIALRSPFCIFNQSENQ